MLPRRDHMITRRALLSLSLMVAPLAAATCDSLADLKLPETTITSAKTVAAGAFTLPPGVSASPFASASFKKLPDFYGSGAFPINYPNEWDKRLGRDGHGIWLHGTPTNTYSRPPRASDGCVVLTNSDLNSVAKHLQVGLTPVIISDQVQWVSTAEWNAEREDFLRAIEVWRADWESRNSDRFLSHYSPNFKAGREIPYCHMEKLCNLEQLPDHGFTVACFPYKIKSASAGWTRAVALFD